MLCLVADAVPAVTRVATTDGVFGRAIFIALNTVGSSRTASFASSLGKAGANGSLSSLSKEESGDESNNGDLHDGCVDADIWLHRYLLFILYYRLS